jgi:hypothetical protein
MMALTDLIADELAGEAPDRFARVNRLSVLAQKLQKEGAVGVKDFANIKACNIDETEYGEDLGVVGGIRMAQYQNPMHNGETLRNIMDAVMPTLQNQGDASRANARRACADELNALLLARQQLGVDTPEGRRLTRRIEELIEETTANDDVPMVSAEFLRGHLPGAEGSQPNDADVPRAFSDREGGDGGPAEASPGAADAFAVGGHRGPEAGEPQVDALAAADAERADQRGAEGAVESTEAGP